MHIFIKKRGKNILTANHSQKMYSKCIINLTISGKIIKRLEENIEVLCTISLDNDYLNHKYTKPQKAPIITENNFALQNHV